MKRAGIFLSGILSCAALISCLIYAVAFLGNFGIANSIDSAARTGSFEAALIDFALLALFALQHWGMTRRGFKKHWSRRVPKPVERSTYVLASSVTLFAAMGYWKPVGGIIWNCGEEVVRVVLLSSYFFGWMVLLFSAFLTDHLDISGLKHTVLYRKGEPDGIIGCREAYLFEYLRYPVYAAWLLILWSAPVMSYSRLAIASAALVYMGASTFSRRADFGVSANVPVRMPLRRRKTKVPPPVKPAFNTSRPSSYPLYNLRSNS